MLPFSGADFRKFSLFGRFIAPAIENAMHAPFFYDIKCKRVAKACRVQHRGKVFDCASERTLHGPVLIVVAHLITASTAAKGRRRGAASRR